MPQKKKSSKPPGLRRLDRYRAAPLDENDPVAYEAHKEIFVAIPRSLYMNLRVQLIKYETTVTRALTEFVCKLALEDPAALKMLSEIKEKTLRRKISYHQHEAGVEGGLNEHERDAIYSIIENRTEEDKDDDQETSD